MINHIQVDWFLQAATGNEGGDFTKVNANFSSLTFDRLLKSSQK
ncbi:hypothetical protein [Sphingobacterium sp. CZ-UAM]|nr:hypothetical protein [Sphingobacterium sp. CZ-UAM]